MQETVVQTPEPSAASTVPPSAAGVTAPETAVVPEMPTAASRWSWFHRGRGHFDAANLPETSESGPLPSPPNTDAGCTEGAQAERGHWRGRWRGRMAWHQKEGEQGGEDIPHPYPHPGHFDRYHEIFRQFPPFSPFCNRRPADERYFYKEFDFY